MTAVTRDRPPQSEVPAPAKRPAPSTSPNADRQHSGTHRRDSRSTWRPSRRVRYADYSRYGTCRCECEPPPSDHQLDAWRAAADTINAAGYLPSLPIDVLRGLYRRGGEDRALAQRLRDGGFVA